MKLIRDQIGREIILKQTPKRIVSLVPSQTELLCDLALENELVGITKFCVHPYHLKATKAIVGGTKKADYDKIKALNPDFILCNKEENSYDMLPKLEKIVLSQGVGDAVTDKRLVDDAVTEMTMNAGQKANTTFSKKDKFGFAGWLLGGGFNSFMLFVFYSFSL